MKQYQVFYWLKMNKHEYLRHMFVTANNAKEACKKCKQAVYEQTRRNAFRPSTKAPEPGTWMKNPYYVLED